MPSPLSEIIILCFNQSNVMSTTDALAERLLSTISAIAVSGVYPTDLNDESNILALGIDVTRFFTIASPLYKIN